MLRNIVRRDREIQPRQRPGVILPLAIIILIALLGFSSLAVDYGRVQLAKAELQDVADAAARYAAQGVYDGTADAKAIAAAVTNEVDGSSLVLSSDDIDLGNWNSATLVFTEGG